MTRAVLLLPIGTYRGALPAMVAAIAAALALDAAAPLAHSAGGGGWLQAQATEGDPVARRRAADLAVRFLRDEAGVAEARRIGRDALIADVRAVTGTAPPAEMPVPELIEARLAPGVDAARMRAGLMLRVPGLAVTMRPGDLAMGRATKAACLLVLGAAAAAVGLAAAIDARSRRRPIAILHRLGAAPARIVAEAAVPAIASVAVGLAAGMALALWLPGHADAPALLLAIPAGLLLIATLAALGSALRQQAALA